MSANIVSPDNVHLAATQKPAQLLSHIIDKTYDMVLMTPDDFLNKHGGAEFDLDKLKVDFLTHVKDYNNVIQKDVGSYSINFCSRILYEIGPDSRKVKKATGDRTWALVFMYEAANGKPISQSEITTRGLRGEEIEKHTVYVSTFKQDGANYVYENTANTMSLTMKQAALLSHQTFERLVTYSFANSKGALLTPLCGACFSRNDINKMAKELGMSRVNLVIALNQSTQSGGHYLDRSDGNMAVCAAIAATRNLKEETVRRSIVTKTTKQYIAKGKNLDKVKLAIVAKYATGGVPAEFSYENLIELFKSVQGTVSKLKAVKASDITASKIDGSDLTGDDDDDDESGGDYPQSGSGLKDDGAYSLPKGSEIVEDVPDVPKLRNMAQYESYVGRLKQYQRDLANTSLTTAELNIKRDLIAHRLQTAENISKTLKK